MKNHTKFKDINENIRFLRCTRRCGSLFSETQIHADFRRLFSFAPLFSFKSTGKRPIFFVSLRPENGCRNADSRKHPYMNKKIQSAEIRVNPRFKKTVNRK